MVMVLFSTVALKDDLSGDIFECVPFSISDSDKRTIKVIFDSDWRVLHIRQQYQDRKVAHRLANRAQFLFLSVLRGISEGFQLLEKNAEIQTNLVRMIQMTVHSEAGLVILAVRR